MTMEFAVRNKLQAFVNYAIKDSALGLRSNVGTLKRMLCTAIDYRKAVLVKDIIDHCESEEIVRYVCGESKSALIFIYQQSYVFLVNLDCRIINWFAHK